MTHERAQRRASPGTTAVPASGSRANRATHQRQGPGILQLQRIVGNRAVQRRIEAALRGPDGPESGGADITDSRIDLVEVASVEGKPTLKQRKVTYKEQKKTAPDGLGATESRVTIEYAVDAETGEIRVGSIRPEYIVTIYTPYVSYGEFVRQFGPIIEKLWTEHGGDIMAFSQSREFLRFHYEPQTRRHEEMHVASRQLALRDQVPRYLKYMRDNGFFTAGVSKFEDQTHFYLKVGWDERVEEIVSHEQIYFLDAQTMVEEYRQRASEEEAPESGAGGWRDFLSQFQ
ncbi:MAG: hypothetical protein WD557_09680 [Dehalococcoidia bacterium]